MISLTSIAADCRENASRRVSVVRCTIIVTHTQHLITHIKGGKPLACLGGLCSTAESHGCMPVYQMHPLNNEGLWDMARRGWSKVLPSERARSDLIFTVYLSA